MTADHYPSPTTDAAYASDPAEGYVVLVHRNIAPTEQVYGPFVTATEASEWVALNRIGLHLSNFAPQVFPLTLPYLRSRQ